MYTNFFVIIQTVVVAVSVKMSARRAVIERKKRFENRKTNSLESNGYIKRKMTTSKVCHYILFPVVSSTVGKSNDFLFHVLSLCWNDKNLLNDPRCQKMFRGLYLEQKIETSDLNKSAETGWFTSSRASDLVKIGKIVGYFIRTFACSVGGALDNTFDPFAYSPIEDNHFNECVSALKGKAVLPVVVKIEISSESCFDVTQFICLKEEIVRDITSGNEIAGSRRSKILKIQTKFHDWAWQVLNTPILEERLKLVNIGAFPVAHQSNENETNKLTPPSKLLTHDRRVSGRTKYTNTKYSVEIFEMN